MKLASDQNCLIFILHIMIYSDKIMQRNMYSKNAWTQINRWAQIKISNWMYFYAYNIQYILNRFLVRMNLNRMNLIGNNN